MPKRSLLAAPAAAALVAALAIGSAGGSAAAATFGTIGARAADPAGGDAWAVRAWSGRPQPDESREACVQVGRLRDGRLVRDVGGRERELGRRDRAVCGYPRSDYAPLSVERLVDDPATPTRFTHTIVGGIAPPGATVTLVVRGEERALPVHPATRSYLAVLDGDVRIGELVLRVGRRTVELGSSEPPPPIVLEAADPLGGPPFVLVREETGDEGPCTEPGRTIAGEHGAYSSAWGSFRELPTVLGTPGFEDDWAPAAPIPHTQGCGEPRDDELELHVRRFDDRLAVFHGMAGRAVERLELRGPDGGRRPVALRDGMFLAVVPSTGALGERATLVATLRGGRTVRERVALGPRDVPNRWERYAALDGGRVLRIRFTTGFQPFVGAEVETTSRRVRVTLLDRFGPTFTDDGYTLSYASIAITKCVDVVLDTPVGDRVVTTGRAGDRPRRRFDADLVARPYPTDRPLRCKRVRPGQRFVR